MIHRSGKVCGSPHREQDMKPPDYVLGGDRLDGPRGWTSLLGASPHGEGLANLLPDLGPCLRPGVKP